MLPYLQCPPRWTRFDPYPLQIASIPTTSLVSDSDIPPEAADFEPLCLHFVAEIGEPTARACRGRAPEKLGLGNLLVPDFACVKGDDSTFESLTEA
ncbi:hypothetical protein MLD38_009465 [Melastoma candidum]|uniref:Uncharacterized protein n=1 Tax=Melastoma candidum TaxID=119954 RepID=A0ACB9RWS4_9MYRT|nr:hypothetical protein MLD38_009465 [Melastoma candidum]